MLLEGKRLVITGVLTDDSIAWHTARIAQEQGASLVLTGFGRGLRLTERSAQRLPVPVDVFELDINDPAHMAALVDELERRWGAVDGALHAIAYAPEDALGGRFLETPAESAGTAFLTSAFSYKTLAVGLRPLMVAAGGGSLVTLDFDNTQAWPAYDWMGVAKAALQAVTRYLARDLGADQIRVNAVSAGPLATVAAKGIPGFGRFDEVWQQRAPLGWDAADPTPVAQMVAVLLSDWAPATSGEVVHVDGGFHAIAAAVEDDAGSLRRSFRSELDHRAGQGAGDALDRLDPGHHQLAERVDVVGLGVDDGVVGPGDRLGGGHALDLGDGGGDRGSLADLGLDEHVGLDHGDPPSGGAGAAGPIIPTAGARCPWTVRRCCHDR